MLNCECPHPPIQHAPAQDFGAAYCLVAGCECGGTTKPATELLVDILRDVLSNKTHVTLEERARNAAAAIVATFEIEVRV
jgi:hypothetical protein